MSDVADDITEAYATAMEEAIESATKAEAERDAALARVAELDAFLELRASERPYDSFLDPIRP